MRFILSGYHADVETRKLPARLGIRKKTGSLVRMSLRFSCFPELRKAIDFLRALQCHDVEQIDEPSHGPA